MARFEGFVILADMRTGSNALEERLNAYDGVTSLGELFNPGFIGRQGSDCLFDTDIGGRDADPVAFLARARGAVTGLLGFRLFSGHDPRVFDHCLVDPAWAKVLLTRPVLESYVSLKIARSTGQWWLGNLRKSKPGKAHFDASEFERFAAERAGHVGWLRDRLRRSGQVPFEITFDEISDDRLIDGLARYLGAGERGRQGRTGKVQNPVALSRKVENVAEMRAALLARDPLDLDREPDYEPRRGAGVGFWMAGASSSLLYMPVMGAGDREVTAWLEALDGATPRTGHDRKGIREWKRRVGRHRSFSVIDHPVSRAHEIFTRVILPLDGGYGQVRATLARSYDVPLPEDPEDTAYDREAHRSAFHAFLVFLKANLRRQTSVRVDRGWATQSAILEGMAVLGVPDSVLRRDDMAAALPAIAASLGGTDPPPLPELAQPRYALEEIYDGETERLARAAYDRDYVNFGFGVWRRA